MAVVRLLTGRAKDRSPTLAAHGEAPTVRDMVRHETSRKQAATARHAGRHSSKAMAKCAILATGSAKVLCLLPLRLNGSSTDHQAMTAHESGGTRPPGERAARRMAHGHQGANSPTGRLLLTGRRRRQSKTTSGARR